MKKVFIEILTATDLFNFPKLQPRKQKIQWIGSKLLTIIGPRRSGKSSLLYCEIEKLLQKGVEPGHIVFINFEDDRLNWETGQADDLLQAWQELYPKSNLNECYFFFDEIQNLPNWEKFVRRLNDIPGTHIAITGNNSKMLATEIATSLRGRSIYIELLPLGFEEYLQFNHIPIKKTGQGKAAVANAFGNYFTGGGFPEVVQMPQQQARMVLQEYYNVMIFRDVVERYAIHQHAVLKYLLTRVAASVGKPLSLRRIFNELKSNGYKLSNNFLYKLADMAEAGYFFKRISRFDFSSLKRNMSDKQAYFIDNGLINAITTIVAGNKDALLENTVFWELYKRYGTVHNSNVYYYTDTVSECDFIIYNEGDTPLPVQVCYSLTDKDTEMREMKGLIRACKHCKVSEGWIITADEARTITVDGCTVHIKCAWEWMLE